MTSREELIKEIKKYMPCSCIPAYKDRGLSAPDCAFCNYVDDMADLCLAREKALLEEKERRVKALENVLIQLKHNNHHLIEEELWRIEQALKGAE